MEEQAEASREEILRSLRLVTLAALQQLQYDKEHTSDPYESYVEGLMLHVFEQFEDLPGALLKSYDIFNEEMGKKGA